MSSASEYLEFVQVWNEGETRKTKVFEVRSKLHGSYLGDIQWFGRWRQYAFFPAEETVFNRDCLREIALLIDGLMEERKKKPFSQIVAEVSPASGQLVIAGPDGWRQSGMDDP